MKKMKKRLAKIGVLSLTAFIALLKTNFRSAFVVNAIQLDIGGAAKAANVSGTTNYNPADPEGSLGLLIGNFLAIAMVIGALIVFLYLIWGAIQWIAAGGDKGKIETARNKITQSVIGLIVLASVVALFIMIQDFLGLDVIIFT